MGSPAEALSELREIASGDTAAFARFVSRVEAAVRAHLRSFAAHVDTEAIVQEAFLRAWQVAPRVEDDGRPEPLLRLTLRIARNLAVDEARRGRRVTPIHEEPGGSVTPPPAPPPDPDPLLRRLIAVCLSLLPTQPRRALEGRLRSGGAEPDAALAAGVGMRLNTFLQNVGRARRLLGECLRRKGVALEEIP